ncbi:unnamed protein product [Soboliphyme baturini]|uniref:alpha-1,2-Mannosidase n=1 Tax=Soboliphyme baturini TaxID=241478 RepID=A0A183IGY2_9BILA|nr:unnamed protein product [Soboliphyme baturini]
MYLNYLNPQTGKWGTKHVSLGALGDSFYEYLLKSWLLTNRTDEQAKRMYDTAMKVIKERLIRKSKGGLLHIVEMRGGMFALDATFDSQHAEYMEIAKGITDTCHQSYVRAVTHLGPEIFRFTDDLEAQTNSNDRYYILRPETVESFFYLWRLTNILNYREWAWDVVLALEKYCKAEAGYSGINDVYNSNPIKNDVQESFFLAETLKYLYLIFSTDTVLPLDKWVFNSEAHALPVHEQTSTQVAL